MAINYIQLGNRIRTSRVEKNLSQEALAEEIDISRTHMGCLERGEKAPSLDALASLAQVLDVTTDWLLGLTNMPQFSVLTDCTKEESVILTQNMHNLKDTLTQFKITCK